MTNNDPKSLLADLIANASLVDFGDNASLMQFRQRGTMILRNVFGDASTQVWNWNAISFKYFDEGMLACTTLLETAIEELELFGSQPQAILASPEGSRRVFVVHGHDDGLKETVARLLSDLDLEPIILHEQANKGRTIIEKFEDHADVSFAVVLLTPDDMAYQAGEDPGAARPRARQNVILELGFFFAQLGRERVAALYTGENDFEKPSDVDGVLYIPVDEHGHWKFGLVKELKAAGIEVDANLLT